MFVVSFCTTLFTHSTTTSMSGEAGEAVDEAVAMPPQPTTTLSDSAYNASLIERSAAIVSPNGVLGNEGGKSSDETEPATGTTLPLLGILKATDSLRHIHATLLAKSTQHGVSRDDPLATYRHPQLNLISTLSTVHVIRLQVYPVLQLPHSLQLTSWHEECACLLGSDALAHSSPVRGGMVYVAHGVSTAVVAAVACDLGMH